MKYPLFVRGKSLFGKRGVARWGHPATAASRKPHHSREGGFHDVNCSKSVEKILSKLLRFKMICGAVGDTATAPGARRPPRSREVIQP